MNTLLAILKVTDSSRDVILAGGEKEEKATKITFIPLQSLPNFAWVRNEDFLSFKMSI